ncbi:MAG: carboxypeptidase-like regulatory domain-containing protein [Gemmataceae bacterium]|nr:carboxypeptidase-like regulatory domain-containing protein [Gemmataceae bacterium]MDW8244510.1 carboxypeptidase-like regulatory domain-containing protein [Thermogemmata sp.]
MYPVSGKVTYKGQPLAGALVTLHPKDSNDPRVERPLGFTQEDGTFTVSTAQKPGAPAGQYVVTVICSRPVKVEGKGKLFSTGGDETVDILGGTYANPNSSKITVEVKPGNNQLPPLELQ